MCFAMIAGGKQEPLDIFRGSTLGGEAKDFWDVVGVVVEDFFF